MVTLGKCEGSHSKDRKDNYNDKYDVVSDLMLNAVASKILTPRRMLQKTSLIAKVNLWNNSFQNMYDML